MSDNRASLLREIERVDSQRFEQLALDLFQYQAVNNPVYRTYLGYRKVSPAAVKKIEDIPFLPISAFKQHEITTGQWLPELVFESSSTTGSTVSRHFLRDSNWYIQQSRRHFEAQYGALNDWHILALLPSYLERGASSLVFMCQAFMDISGKAENGFYLHNMAELQQNIQALLAAGHKLMLFGVTYALLDFAAAYPGQYDGLYLMETGGMKGRRKEITRTALHAELHAALKGIHIHSEYGMTELLSQAYANESQWFTPAPTMQVRIREVNDPMHYVAFGQTGGIDVIDLANVDTCSFISTDDLGQLAPDGRFKVLGRFDQSDVRGCNLMVEG